MLGIIQQRLSACERRSNSPEARNLHDMMLHRIIRRLEPNGGELLQVFRQHSATYFQDYVANATGSELILAKEMIESELKRREALGLMRDATSP